MGDKATLVVTAAPNPDEMQSVQAYLAGVMPLLLSAGGQLVKRQKVSHVVNGRQSGMVLVMDFDDVDAVTELFSSTAYSELMPARDKGFAEMNILVAGDM